MIDATPGNVRQLGSAAQALSYQAEFDAAFGKPYRRAFKTPAGDTPRPVCASCRRSYGSRSTETLAEIRTAEQGPPAAYRGNAHLVEEVLHVWGSEGGKPAAKLTRVLWDGETYAAPFRPFCTLRCALVFARAAYRGGWRAPA